MKKSLFKALLPTMAMILVAVMALTGTTYAWFTNVQSASVENLDIKVTSAANLKIATIGTTNTPTAWTNNMTWTTINASSGAVCPSKSDFKACSTTGTAANGALTFYTATLNDAGTHITEIKAATNEYYKFDLYIWNDSTETKTITLSGSTVANSSAAKVDTAMRVAVIPQNTASYTAGATLDPIANKNNASAIIWEVNSTDHAFGGIATATYGLATTGTGLNIPVNTADTKATEVTGMKTSAKDLGMSIPANSVGKLTVYIWLEGQDCDCINSITNGELNINLKVSAQ